MERKWRNAASILEMPKNNEYYEVELIDGTFDEKPFRNRGGICGFMVDKPVVAWRETDPDKLPPDADID